MRRAQRATIAMAIMLISYLLVLTLGGWLGDGCVRGKVEGRLADALAGEATVGNADLGLFGGTVRIDDLAVRRDQGGLLRVRVDQVDVEVAPMGWVVVDRGLRDVHIRGVELELSGASVLDLRGHRRGPPLAFGSLTIDDARLAFVPTGYLPGLGRVELTIERARCGPTVMRTALSWVFALRELVARVDLPGGITVRIGYADGTLTAAGGMFGATPVELPFTMPVPTAETETAQLIALGKELGKRLAADAAQRWLDKALAPD